MLSSVGYRWYVGFTVKEGSLLRASSKGLGDVSLPAALLCSLLALQLYMNCGHCRQLGSALQLDTAATWLCCMTQQYDSAKPLHYECD